MTCPHREPSSGLVLGLLLGVVLGVLLGLLLGLAVGFVRVLGIAIVVLAIVLVIAIAMMIVMLIVTTTLGGYPLFDGDPPGFVESFAAEQDSASRAVGFDPGLMAHQAWYPVTVEEFKWGAACLRDLARSYWCLTTDTDPRSLAWDNPLIADSFRYEEQWWAPTEMQEMIERTLEAGLRDFSPRLIRADSDNMNLRGRDRSRALAQHFTASDDLFAVCCLELFNHIAEGAIYGTCANESCGRWFVRQQGRAEHDQRRRTGVKYCSHACARQQTQRSYRRRAK